MSPEAGFDNDRCRVLPGSPELPLTQLLPLSPPNPKTHCDYNYARRTRLQFVTFFQTGGIVLNGTIV